METTYFTETAEEKYEVAVVEEPYVAKPVANYHCRTGENPLWDEVRHAVLWTDIPAGRIFEYDVLTGQHRQIYSGEPVGGFTLQDDDSLLLLQSNRISCMLPNGMVRPVIEGIDDDMVRFNDVIADAHGRVFAGTIGRDDQRGGLYRIGVEGTVTPLFKGTGCANGMGFSPDGQSFYWTDSTAGKIFRFRYEPTTGELHDREVFVAVPKKQGTPDGLTVDIEGCVWSARWGGAAVYRYSPSGEQIMKIDLPVEKVSSVAFGGPYLDDLYVTTAGGQDGADTADGTLYRIKTRVAGRLEFRSRILTE